MIRYVYLLLLVMAISGTYAVAPVYAQKADARSENELDEVLAKIIEKQRSLKTFTATFNQTKTSDLLREPLYSAGVVYFDVDGRILMEVTSPSPLTLLFEGNRQVIYYPDLSRIEQKAFVKTGDIFKEYIGIGASVKTLKMKFTIELVAGASASGYCLKMVPRQRDMAKFIEVIEVGVDSGLWLPEQINFKGTGGDHTSIRMHYTAINEPLPPGIFDIEMPEDIVPTAGQENGH